MPESNRQPLYLGPVKPLGEQRWVWDDTEAGDAPCYSILCVPFSACSREFEDAYRKVALVVHPDVGGSVSRFNDVVHAFELLSDPDRRQHYDASWQRETCSIASNENADSTQTASGARFKDTLLDDLCDIIDAASKIEQTSILESLGDVARNLVLERQQARRSDAGMALQHDPDCDASIPHDLHDSSSESDTPAVMTSASGDLVVETTRLRPTRGSMSPWSQSHCACGKSHLDQSPCTCGRSTCASHLTSDDAFAQLGAEPPRPEPRCHGISRRAGPHGEVLYEASVKIWGLRVRSRLYPKLETAVDRHVALIRARQLCKESNSFSEDDKMREGFAHLQTGGYTFSSQVRAHQLVDRKLYAPESSDLGLAILMRKQLKAAAEESWQALAKTWVDIHHKYGIGHSLAELEAATAAWEGDMASRQQRRLVQAARRSVKALDHTRRTADHRHHVRSRRGPKIAELVSRIEAIAYEEDRSAVRDKRFLYRRRHREHHGGAASVPVNF